MTELRRHECDSLDMRTTAASSVRSRPAAYRREGPRTPPHVSTRSVWISRRSVSTRVGGRGAGGCGGPRNDGDAVNVISWKRYRRCSPWSRS